MGVPQALRSETLVTALPYVEIALGVLLLATWSWPLAVVAAATTALFAAYWVLVLRVLRRGEEVDCGCFGALGDDRVSGTTLARNSVAGGARRPRHRLRSRRLGRGARRPATSARRTGGGSSSRSRWRPRPVLVVGLRRPEPAVADDDLLDYERAPIPFALLEDESGTRDHAARSWPPSDPSCLLFLSSDCWACETVAERLPDWMSRLGPVEISTVFTEPLEDVPADACGPTASRLWFDVEQGATDTFAQRTTVRRPAGGRRRPGRRPGRRCGRRRQRSSRRSWPSWRRSRTCRCPVEPEHASIGAPATRHATGTTTAVTTVTATPEFLKPADGPPALHLAWGTRSSVRERGLMLACTSASGLRTPGHRVRHLSTTSPHAFRPSDPRGTLMAGALRAAVVRRLSPCSGGQFT